MAYSDIQLISYEIFTGPTLGAPDGRLYRGLSSDLDDMAYRVTLMREAIECAQRAAFKNADCLKVFVAPEFYFRGSKGAYPIAKVVGEAKGELAKNNLLDLLRASVKHADFEHWLFVFGTIIASSAPPGPTVKGSQSEAYNICLVHRGNQGIEGSRVIVKEHKSGIDFLKSSPAADAVLDDSVRHLMAGKKDANLGWTANRGAGKESGAKEYEGLGIFALEGITFGVEICLDHAEARLRTSPPGPNDPWVQVQIVPSCGMSIMKRSVVACKDGLVFNVDGLGSLKADNETSAKTWGFHSQLRQILTPFTTGGNATLRKVTTPIFNPPHGNASRIAPVFEDLSAVGKWADVQPVVRVYPKLKVPPQPATARPDAYLSGVSKRWEPDSSHSSCQRCGAQFTMTRRRHHCRACGRVLCSSCAPEKQTLRVPGYDEPVRVCHDCCFQYTGKLKR